jgi:alpha-beta hydrolase superfamily lysophospholipase
MSELYTAGKPIEEAQFAMILMHGRGASAASILKLAEELYHPDFAYLAPQAAGQEWYPLPFLAPLEQNDPALSAALDVVAALLDLIGGVPAENVILGGFSQGACLQWNLRRAMHSAWAGCSSSAAGWIGPLWHAARLQDRWRERGFDRLRRCRPHIPQERVEETAAVLTGLGGVRENNYIPVWAT